LEKPRLAGKVIFASQALIINQFPTKKISPPAIDFFGLKQ
jgi:hypothetical protein